MIDSGARMDHPDLAGNIIKGFNLVPKNQNAKNPVAPTPTDPFYYNYNDTLFHGTLVAGTLAAMSNNLKGVTGVAWNVSWGCLWLWACCGMHASSCSSSFNALLHSSLGLSLILTCILPP